MKLKSAVIGMSLFLGSISFASIKSPKDNIGFSIQTIDLVGALPCSINSTTGTAAVLCASGRGLVYGVVVASDVVTTFAVMRDSNTANTTSSSFTAISPTGTGSNSSGVGTTQLMRFPVPIQFSNGLSVNLTAVPGNGGLWTILYRNLDSIDR